MALVALIIFVALFSAFLTPYSPIEQHPRDSLSAPSAQYLLGTDEFGRDILSRLMVGATNSMRVTFTAIAIAASIGSIIGMVAGYFGGVLDALLMRATDVLFAFPAILLALFIVSVLGASAINAIIAIAIVYMPIFARVARGPTLLTKTYEYVQAAEALSASHVWRLFKHVLPNIAAPVIVQITLALAQATLTEAALSYLGLGILPPNPSWGSMLSDARKLMEIAPWMAIAPGAAIMIAVLGFNLFGDGLRDWLDPQLRNQM
jgi:peptide/nickel transport system permease protein